MNGAELLQKTAQQLRELYCDRRRFWHLVREGVQSDYGAHAIPRWDGGEDSAGRRTRSIWERLARFVLEHGCEPGRFIRAQFDHADGRPPEPSVLMNDTALGIYRDATKEEARALPSQLASELESLRLALHVESGDLKRGATPQSLLARVLRRLEGQISPLLRYSTALVESRREGIRDHDRLELVYLAEFYRDRALLQYSLAAEGYDVAWARVIPEDLRVEFQACRTEAQALEEPAPPEEPVLQPPPQEADSAPLWLSTPGQRVLRPDLFVD